MFEGGRLFDGAFDRSITVLDDQTNNSRMYCRVLHIPLAETIKKLENLILKKKRIFTYTFDANLTTIGYLCCVHCIIVVYFLEEAVF